MLGYALAALTGAAVCFGALCWIGRCHRLTASAANSIQHTPESVCAVLHKGDGDVATY